MPTSKRTSIQRRPSPCPRACLTRQAAVCWISDPTFWFFTSDKTGSHSPTFLASHRGAIGALPRAAHSERSRPRSRAPPRVLRASILGTGQLATRWGRPTALVSHTSAAPENSRRPVLALKNRTQIERAGEVLAWTSWLVYGCKNSQHGIQVFGEDLLGRRVRAPGAVTRAFGATVGGARLAWLEPPGHGSKVLL